MSLVPPFDLHNVFVAPWADDFGGTVWVVIMGFLVTLACGLVGNYLILRRMALVGDAIRHSVLPGIAIAFLLSNSRGTTAMFAGALAAGVLGEGFVFGVEAGPETAKLARKNLAANGFPGVKIVRGAVVASGEGEVDFGQRPAFWASALKGRQGWPENAEVIRVPARPVGKLLERFRPSVICCDIEGGELEVLAEPLPGVRLVVVETHPQVYGAEGVKQIAAALAAQGFATAGGAKADTLVFARGPEAATHVGRSASG